ncbi:MAG: ROK family protein [Planctomycetaceae bacterium]
MEIGGTKLQLGVGAGDGTLTALVRRAVDPDLGAAGIRTAISELASELIPTHNVTRIGIGFGGPINGSQGRVTTSHQISGWDNFPIVKWCRDTWGLPTALGNDCDVAALAEATQGAGRNFRRVLYVTVGTGVGGGLVIDGEISGKDRPAASEIGHLRIGLDTGERTVEQMASGRGMCDRLWQKLSNSDGQARDLMDRCQQRRENLTGQIVSAAASADNPLAQTAIADACRALGWAIGQMVTITAPEIVVVGGGISLMGEHQFFAPVRSSAARSVFGPLADSFRIVPAQLGELAVVHGALAIADRQDPT